MASPSLVAEATRLGILPKPEFAISRTADWPVAIPRERTDRRYVDLERTRAIEPAWKSWVSGIGVIAFMIFVWTVL